MLALLVAAVFYLFPRGPSPDRPDVRVFFTAWQSASDFELTRRGKSLLFVSIPPMEEPSDRLVFASAKVRPINIGKRSLQDMQVVTIASDSLWNPHLGDAERLAVISTTGSADFQVEVQRLDQKWVATRTIPRLDPMNGIPCPIFFLLQVAATTQAGASRLECQGELEIRVSGEDWIGLQHTLDIRCVEASSAEEFIAKCRVIARSLRMEGYPDVPVMLATTGGQGVKPLENGPMIIQASIDTFVAVDGGRLSDL